MPGSTLKKLFAGMTMLALAACAAGEPREPTKTVDEIRSGPGVFSGEDGEFVIYRN